MPHVTGSSVITSADRLSLTTFFAIATHMIFVFGVDFSPTDRLPTHVNTLDIVLVQTRVDKTPNDPSYLAQANQEGGGESTATEHPSAPLPVPFVNRTPNKVTASLPLSATRSLDRRFQTDNAQPKEAAPKSVLAQTSRHSEQKVRRPPPPRPKSTRKPRPTEPVKAGNTPSVSTEKINAAALVRRSLALTSLNAEIQQRLRAYAERPRRKWITARTREYKYASYMEAWRAKVEQVGNLNYPDKAVRRKLSGNLLLSVAINTDGTINEITLHRSSGSKILDDAAIRIVKLAAPFAPLPENIRREVDILHIERTWQFLAGNRLAAR
uniref:Protein TonB n=1 Tax=Candidatus Kentrum eta TaxID=2126337 RepID=A0A450UHN4_9GAMM|nr:MAG: protein TonB [Candidatus Kentron sp. H]VFJ93063.1 MAG: protein TonB [Candidatus Kentron sp. H]VFJ99907.1 MAG: protein TonB [Candidatus Kentron sp. H]